MALALGSFAMERRNLFRVLAGAHEIEAKISLKALLLEIERNERPADAVRQHSAEDRVNQCRPDQVAGNENAVQMQRRFFGQFPKYEDEGTERHDGTQDSDADR